MKQFHGLIHILQPIYKTNGRRANVPTIHYTDIVTLRLMEEMLLAEKFTTIDSLIRQCVRCGPLALHWTHLPALESHAKFYLDFAEYEKE